MTSCQVPAIDPSVRHSGSRGGRGGANQHLGMSWAGLRQVDSISSNAVRGASEGPAAISGAFDARCEVLRPAAGRLPPRRPCRTTSLPRAAGSGHWNGDCCAQALIRARSLQPPASATAENAPGPHGPECPRRGRHRPRLGSAPLRLRRTAYPGRLVRLDGPHRPGRPGRSAHTTRPCPILSSTKARTCRPASTGWSGSPPYPSRSSPTAVSASRKRTPPSTRSPTLSAAPRDASRSRGTIATAARSPPSPNTSAGAAPDPKPPSISHGGPGEGRRPVRAGDRPPDGAEGGGRRHLR